MSDELYEMANLVKSETGLNAVVFISPKGNAKHGCRVKVSNQLGKMNIDDSFSIALHDLSVEGEIKINTKEMNALLAWILLNKETIRGYWDSKLTTKEMANAIQSI